jgi:hypothetical protein
MFTSAQALGANVCTSTLTMTATITEIELEDGTIYTPPAEFVPDGYSAGDGHNVPLDDLTELVPQPSSAGVKVTRRSHAPEPLQDEFKYLELEWSALGSVTEFQSVLSQLGVLSAIENDVTVTAKDETLGWQRFNGTAVRPQMGSDVRHERYFIRNLVILVKYLELSE